MTMQVLETARQKVAQLLGGVEDVGEAVVRGERLHAGKCFAVAYVDFADDVVGRAEGLREFQERILGEDYFNSPGDLRWNNYIYIVAGPKSVEQPDFQRAKAVIEADEDFARKRSFRRMSLPPFSGPLSISRPARPLRSSPSSKSGASSSVKQASTASSTALREPPCWSG